MGKLLVASVLIALVAVPIAVSRDPSAARGLRKALLYTLAANVAYLFLLRYLLPRLGL